MQGWLFFNAAWFWQKPQAKALLTSVPIGRMIVLDLASELSPQYTRLESYFGQPFIFCMLHNYGGVDGFYGNADFLFEKMVEARNFPNVTLVGTGLTPEGINQNYVMYDLMNELAWRTAPPNKTSWVESYASRRYNSNDSRLLEAWKLLMNSVYSNAIKKNHGGYIITRRPNIHSKQDLIWYSIDDVITAWDLVIEVIRDNIKDKKDEDKDKKEDKEKDKGDGKKEKNSDEEEEEEEEEHFIRSVDDRLPSSSRFLQEEEEEEAEIKLSSKKKEGIMFSVVEQPTFLHDVVDLTRQVLQILGGQVALRMIDFYHNADKFGVMMDNSNLQMIFEDMDNILATSPDFLLGAWKTDAEAWATNEEERKLYAYNALNQVTIWGPGGEILDYALKQWSGLISDYVKPRWKLFGDTMVQCLEEEKPFDKEAFQEEVFQKVEELVSLNVTANYPAEPEGNPLELALEIHGKYRPFFNETFLNHLRVSGPQLEADKGTEYESQESVMLEDSSIDLLTANINEESLNTEGLSSGEESKGTVGSSFNEESKSTGNSKVYPKVKVNEKSLKNKNVKVNALSKAKTLKQFQNSIWNKAYNM